MAKSVIPHAPKLTVMGLGATLLVTTLAGCWGTRSELPPVHVIQNMDDQQKFDPQEDNEFFADGRSMRKPVEGTVAVGHLKDNDHLHRGRDASGRLADALPAELEFSGKDAEALLDRGKERYQIFCAPCHGDSGLGNGIVTRRGGGFQVAPKNLHEPRLKAMPLGYFYKVMAQGQGTMLSYASQIPDPRDRWAIAAWVRVLQRADVKQPAAAGGGENQ